MSILIPASGVIRPMYSSCSTLSSKVSPVYEMEIAIIKMTCYIQGTSVQRTPSGPRQVSLEQRCLLNEVRLGFVNN